MTYEPPAQQPPPGRPQPGHPQPGHSPVGPPPGPPVAPGADPRSPRRGLSPAILVVATVAAAGVGVLAGYLVFGTSILFGDEPSDVGAAEHLNYACAMVERMGDTHSTIDDLGSLDEDPWHYEVTAAGALAAAAALDPAYEHLDRIGLDGMQAATTLDFDRWLEFADDLLAECEA